MLPRLGDGLPLPGANTDVPDSLLRNVWNVCPPIAALVDLPRASQGDAESLERCQEFLGVLDRASPPVGTGITHIEWSLPPSQLRDMKAALDLKPTGLLSDEAMADAHLEWVLAHREGRFDANRWCQDNLNAHRRHSLVSGRVDAQMEALRARPELEDGMDLPRRVLGASLNIVVRSVQTSMARAALVELIEPAPRLVIRQLTLAVCLAHAASETAGCPT